MRPAKTVHFPALQHLGQGLAPHPVLVEKKGKVESVGSIGGREGFGIQLHLSQVNGGGGADRESHSPCPGGPLGVAVEV